MYILLQVNEYYFIGFFACSSNHQKSSVLSFQRSCTKISDRVLGTPLLSDVTESPSTLFFEMYQNMMIKTS